jgi:propionyl-CoA carboxylase beta chain
MLMIQAGARPGRLRTHEAANASRPHPPAAERGYVDDVIRPRDTRRVLIGGLEMLRHKVAHNPRKKHGNIPL